MFLVLKHRAIPTHWVCDNTHLEIVQEREQISLYESLVYLSNGRVRHQQTGQPKVITRLEAVSWSLFRSSWRHCTYLPGFKSRPLARTPARNYQLSDVSECAFPPLLYNVVPILGAGPRFDASLTTELKNVVSMLLAASPGLILHQDEGISRRLSEPVILRIRSLKP